MTDKVRFGVVGTNFITDWVIAGARQDSRFRLEAVCSRRQETAESFARKHGIPHTFTSLEDMASSPLIDAVYIATPNFLHASQSILCMSHGKHVLCEKPLASNADEARRMAEASARYGVALMEAMKTTLTPNFLSVMENIRRAGKIRRYFASFCQYSSRYDRFKEGVVMNAFRPEMSNGAVMDIGVYTIYPMAVLFGMPEKISASGIILPTGADGQGSAILTYPGMEATVIYSKISDSCLPSEIQGEDGTIAIDRINMFGKVTFTPRAAGGPGGSGKKPQPEDISITGTHDGYMYEVSEFIDLVLSGKRESEINSHRNSIITLSITDEIRRQTGVVFPADSSGKAPGLERNI